jgi:transposase
MFLRCTTRKKNGKEHSYWSIVENKRCAGNKIVQRHVLYLGELDEPQYLNWESTLKISNPIRPPETAPSVPQTDELFPAAPAKAGAEKKNPVRFDFSQMQLRHPRQWGACWLFSHFYQELGLDRFWAERLPRSRKGTRWDLILQTLCAYRLIAPGSEWCLHRHWFEHSAMADLLGGDFTLAEIHRLYECHDLILEHQTELFAHLTQRWKDLFNAKFDVLLYDLTSTYFESEPPFGEGDKRRFGYSRDKRPDCVQVVIALIVTPEGFPLGYEVMSGNTSDKTTLKGFLEKIEKEYGQAQRIWVMDRGIPTEETLEQMRQSNPPVLYLVGTPKGRLSQLEAKLAGLSWQQAREGVEVKLLEKDRELYVLAKSADRVSKERAMRRRQLKGLWHRLKELEKMDLKRDALLLKLGAARQQSPAAWRLVKIQLPTQKKAFGFTLKKTKLKAVRQREGRYLLRSNLVGRTAAELWGFYLQLAQVEEAFRHLKGDLGVRPIFHQRMERIEAHIFIAFLAYCVHVSLGQRLKALAPGLTTRSALEKFGALQMIDVHIPTSDGRELILSRYTQPEADQKLLLEKLKLKLPGQPPPRITLAQIPKADPP